MEEHHHDDRTAECQLPPSRGTSRPRAAPTLHQLHQPCQDQEREGGHADRRGGLTAALPGDDGDPAANPVHHPPSGRVNQPRAAEQSAPPSAAACTAGRKTDGPLYGAAAPGGGGRPEADPAARLPQPSGPHPATHRETRPVTVLGRLAYLSAPCRAQVAAPRRRHHRARPSRTFKRRQPAARPRILHTRRHDRDERARCRVMVRAACEGRLWPQQVHQTGVKACRRRAVVARAETAAEEPSAVASQRLPGSPSGSPCPF